MRTPARALLAALALTLAGAAAAQAPGERDRPTIVSGGVRLTLEPAITFEVSLEHPLLLTPDGWRVGLVTSVRGHAGRSDASAAALAGLTATLPAGATGAVQAQLLYRAVWATTGARAGPELLIAFTTTIP